MYTYGYTAVTTYDENDFIITHLIFDTYTQAIDHIEERGIKVGNTAEGGFGTDVTIKSVIVKRH
jgi:hypothetical protein|tara:strand:- start:674 stop:865 length:192 start_codon:yes stop_codon:yes gene_type:complete